MMCRKGLVGVAMVMLALGSTALADDTGADISSTGSNPTAGEATGTSRGALMSSFDAMRIGPVLDKANINIYGSVEVGYLYDLSSPNDITPAKSAPGDFIMFPGAYKNAGMLNQVDLAVERAIDPSTGNWDIGFKIEGMYGRDAFFTHSNGILDETNKDGGLRGPFDQPDLLQAYVTFGVPVGGGLTITVGKFVDVLGAEQINPAANLFYTHSYSFSYGLPFTQTGFLFSYEFMRNPIASDITYLTLGMTRGWNQTLYDNNGEPDGVLYMSHHSGPMDWKVGAIFGPEGVLPFGPPDNQDFWCEFDANGSLSLSDNMSIAGNLLIGNAPHSGTWTGLTGYFHYAIDPHVAINSRLEYYHDEHGLTTGVGGPDINYWEVGLGCAITPMPGNQWLGGMQIRPEIRYDWADQPVFDFINFDQVVFACDFVWKF
jgi:hypothetical protein